ncbi:peptidylprolyl isomerase [Parasphingorhabdus sp. NYA22]
MLRKFIREPLVHFLGGALLIFAFFWATGSDRDPADYAINIGDADIARLEAGWVQNFRRAPTQAELDSLIDQEIAEEIYYREALRLGLDKNDPVIRRRLFTKMRFVDSEEAADVEPSDDLLQEWIDKNPGKYSLTPLYDFEQIYLGQISAADARQRIDQLNDGAEPSTFAQSLSMPETFARASTTDIARQFGDRFAEQLDKLETGIWSGPVASGFGTHAVKISAKAPGQKAVLDNIRQQVLNDWRSSRQAQQKAEALARYKAQYEVTVTGRP